MPVGLSILSDTAAIFLFAAVGPRKRLGSFPATAITPDRIVKPKPAHKHGGLTVRQIGLSHSDEWCESPRNPFPAGFRLTEHARAQRHQPDLDVGMRRSVRMAFRMSGGSFGHAETISDSSKTELLRIL